MTMKTFPYNFAPLSSHVFLPDAVGAQRVSHDLPFADGLSGEIDYTLQAHTPLLVGQARTAHDGKPGEVHPFCAPDGRHGIPGSSLRGMIRAVLEVAAYGRMGNVDDTRYALRDISGKHVKEAYIEAVKPIQAGFIVRGPDGLPRLTQCKYASVSHRALEAWCGAHTPLFQSGMSVAEKYQRWQEQVKGKTSLSDNPFDLNFDPTAGSNDRTLADNLGEGQCRGTLVLTGQISDSTRKSGKKHDFLFYDESPPSEEISSSDWRDFLFVHCPADKDKDKGDKMSWPGHWENRYYKGEKVPVFYLKKGKRVHLGLAQLPRLVGKYSVHDCLRAASSEHLATQAAGPDLPALLFGYADPEGALRGRVACEPAFAIEEQSPQESDPLILNSPKPSFFPAYLEQPQDEQLSGKMQYTTYLGDSHGAAPHLRGWKRYPVREHTHIPPLAPDQRENKKVQSILYPLPADSRFAGRIVFHNLRPFELGALLWTLTWGERTQCRHSLGMGKPFGYGAVSVTVGPVDIRANDATASTAPDAAQCRGVFEKAMEDWCRATIHTPWLSSAPLAQLLAMAEPTPDTLCYPDLAAFQKFKTNGRVLPPYKADAPNRESKRTHHQITVDTDNAGAQWVDTTIKELIVVHHGKGDEILRGKQLAEAWQALESASLKAEAREAIVRAWKEKGYWDNPPGKASKKAKAIYDL